MPGLGASGSKFQISTGWRYSHAHQSYFDSRVNHDFDRSWRPQEKLSVLDVSARYRINRRLSTTLTVPIVFNSFSMLTPPLGDGRGLRRGWRGQGLGDISLYTDSWLLDPSEHPFGNFSLGVGIKIPTGNWNQKAVIPDETGRNFIRRAVYPAAIQPGDGGTGIIVGFNTFKILRSPTIFRGHTLFASGSYLINARNRNGTGSIVRELGVPLNAAFLGETTNSVTDSYNLQGGVALQIPRTWDKKYFKNLRFRITGNWQGVPSHDLIGGSKGYRQPGWGASIGPGMTYGLGNNFWIVDVPIVVAGHIDGNRSAIPGLPVVGPGGAVSAATFNPNRNLGMMPRVAVAIRYVRSF